MIDDPEFDAWLEARNSKVVITLDLSTATFSVDGEGGIYKGTAYQAMKMVGGNGAANFRDIHDGDEDGAARHAARMERIRRVFGDHLMQVVEDLMAAEFTGDEDYDQTYGLWGWSR